MNEVKIENTHIQGYYSVIMLQIPRDVHQTLIFVNAYVMTSNNARLDINGNAIQNWSKI